jgi:uncharacterized membrane protein
MYKKQRIEALSDGIFAIAMTLLVLELKVPANIVPGHLWQALHADREGWLAFLITFFIAARYWVLQHDVFHLTDKFNHHAVLVTFIFLGFVTVLPFSSSLVGHHGSEPLAFSLYCANQAAIGASLIYKLEYLRLRNHVSITSALQYVRGRLYSLTGVMATTAIAVWFIPMRWIFIVPTGLILATRRFIPSKPEE